MTLTAPPPTGLDRAAAEPARAARPRRRLAGSGTATRTLISAVDLRRHRVAYFAVLALALVTFSLVFLFPVYWMVTGAVKSPAEFAEAVPTWWPHSWHPETYATAWTNMRIAKYFANTVMYALGGWIFCLVVDVLAAYALSKLKP